MASETVALIETVITCPICLDHFKDPRLLPCTHTYCLQCIKNIALKNNDLFECPLRDGAKISKNEIDSLPLNPTVREIVASVGKWVENVFHVDHREPKLGRVVKWYDTVYAVHILITKRTSFLCLRVNLFKTQSAN